MDTKQTWIMPDIIDAYQGVGGQDSKTPFGYIGLDGEGGYFFEWRDTLDETLASLEPDEIDSPETDFFMAALYTLELAIGDDFERLHDAAYGPHPYLLCRFGE